LVSSPIVLLSIWDLRGAERLRKVLAGRVALDLSALLNLLLRDRRADLTSVVTRLPRRKLGDSNGGE